VSRKAFVRLDGALAQAMERLQLEPILREARALTLWPEVVGPQVAEATRAENVRDGVLSVVTRTSTWAFELTFHKERILRSISARLGRGVVRDIRFRVGSPDEPEAPPPPEPVPMPADLVGTPLSDETVAAIAAATAAQPDTDLRDRVAAAIAAEERRAAWLRQHGYRPCTRCGALHRRPTADCPACRRDAQEETESAPVPSRNPHRSEGERAVTHMKNQADSTFEEGERRA
jgi:predicted nucleic acid-binding Zn ribbon protein